MVMSKKNPQLGFGLIELIVSLSIVTIVTSIVMARHNAFNSAVLLRNQAYEIAFVIREAQQLAVSGTQIGDLTTIQKQRYAVAFSTASSGTANRQVVLLYKDNNNNGVFDSNDTVVKSYRLDSRFEITSMTTAGTSRGDIRVLFERPLFDAIFYQGTSNTPVSGPVRIVLRPVGSATERAISVTTSGQVTVENN